MDKSSGLISSWKQDRRAEPVQYSFAAQQRVVGSRPWAAAWMDGQGFVPYEQNTQQWPSSGLSNTPHPLHS